MTEAGVHARLVIRPGDTLLARCNGGGGYGDALEREPERVLTDVREGYVTRGRAAEAYGVVIDEHRQVDFGATEAARRALIRRRERGS